MLTDALGAQSEHQPDSMTTHRPIPPRTHRRALFQLNTSSPTMTPSSRIDGTDNNLSESCGVYASEPDGSPFSLQFGGNDQSGDGLGCTPVAPPVDPNAIQSRNATFISDEAR